MRDDDGTFSFEAASFRLSAREAVQVRPASPRLRVPASPCPRVSVSPRLRVSHLRVSASQRKIYYERGPPCRFALDFDPSLVLFNNLFHYR